MFLWVVGLDMRSILWLNLLFDVLILFITDMMIVSLVCFESLFVGVTLWMLWKKGERNFRCNAEQFQAKISELSKEMEKNNITVEDLEKKIEELKAQQQASAEKKGEEVEEEEVQ